MFGKSDDRDLGLRAVREVYRRAMIDEEWSVWEDRGFSWWGYRLRQRVWAEPGFLDHGFKIYRLCAQTDCLRDVKITDEVFQKVAWLARLATVASLLVDPSARRLSTFSSVYVHDENFDWLAGGIFAWIAVIQLIEAELIAENLPGELAEVSPDYSAHPTSGPRLVPDDTLNLIRDAVRPFGEKRRPWARSGDYEKLVPILNEGNCFASNGGGSLTAEFPFSAETILLQMIGDADHPRLGSGLRVALMLPLEWERIPAVRLAAELNRIESRPGNTNFPFLGSWTVQELGRGYTPAFVSFYPSCFYARGMAFNVAMNQVGRAQWIRRWFGTSEGDVTLALWRRVREISKFLE